MLKDAKGFVALSETYLYVGNTKTRMEKVAHVYRYSTDAVMYTCTDASGVEEDELLPYSFHYDQDLKPFMEEENGENNEDLLLRHPPNHLQVLHAHPRFVTDDSYTLAEFIQRVKLTCFEDDTLVPYSRPLYKISHT